MSIILRLYLLNTVLFSVVLVKQFLIIVRSPYRDEKLITKIVVFVCCLAMMAAMWLCYFMIRGAAWFFFLMAIIVIVWVYKDEKFKH
jgi:hypothetical protein